MGKLIYSDGEITRPETDVHRIIANLCDLNSLWDSDLCRKIDKRWKTPKNEYVDWQKNGYYTEDDNEQMVYDYGVYQLIPVRKRKPEISICNIILQKEGMPMILWKDIIGSLTYIAFEKNASLHISKRSIEETGTNWNDILPYLSDDIIVSNIDVYVYK